MSIALKVFLTCSVFLIPGYACWLNPNKEVEKVGLIIVLTCVGGMILSAVIGIWS